MPPNRLAVIPPLVTVIIVDTDDIEVILLAAELWLGASTQHVPSLKHRGLVFRRLQHIVRTLGITDDMDDRLGCNQP
jgi:hypothetical protein